MQFQLSCCQLVERRVSSIPHHHTTSFYIPDEKAVVVAQWSYKSLESERERERDAVILPLLLLYSPHTKQNDSFAGEILHEMKFLQKSKCKEQLQLYIFFSQEENEREVSCELCEVTGIENIILLILYSAHSTLVSQPTVYIFLPLFLQTTTTNCHIIHFILH